MLEQDLGLRTRESFISTSQPEFPTIPYLRGTVYAFGSATKQKIIEASGGRCAECGSTRHLQCHHKVPQCLGGKDTAENGVALCQNDHLYWDNSTLRDGVMYPGIPLENAPGGLIGNKNVFKKGLGQIRARNRR